MKRILVVAIVLGFAMLSHGQQFSVQHWTVHTEDVPLLRTTWSTSAGNSLEIHVRGNFACISKPIVSDSGGIVKGTCSRRAGVTEAIYRDPALLFSANLISVQFLEYGVGLVYYVNIEELGTPLIMLGY